MRLIFTESLDPISNHLYKESNKQIETFTWILHTLFTKVSVPFGIIPMAIISYYLYFTTELGSEAFYWLNFGK